MPFQALILFAHGARDPRWAEPFAAVVARIRAERPGLPVMLAFLEHLEPDLGTALQALAAQGVTQTRIVPVFFGRGGHLREDFPVLLEEAARRVPGMALEVAQAAGEDESVQEALAAYALKT